METIDKQTINDGWELLLTRLTTVIGKRPADLNSVLFLIGVQELGKGPLRFSKEQKQDLMHVAVCTVLSLPGYYVPLSPDADGWPRFEQQRPVPPGDLLGQEAFLKQHIIDYFNQALSLNS
jgi:hypothetical protein